MNTKQRCVVVAGFIVILLLGLFPPWVVRSTPTEPEWPLVNTILRPLDPSRPISVFSARHGERGWCCRVDASLLLVQFFLVSAVTGIIVMFLGDSPQRPTQKPDE